MMAPTMAQAKMPRGILPPVLLRTVSALKNTPEPMTMPTTIHTAVTRPYFFSSWFSMFFSPDPQVLFFVFKAAFL